MCCIGLVAARKTDDARATYVLLLSTVAVSFRDGSSDECCLLAKIVGMCFLKNKWVLDS